MKFKLNINWVIEEIVDYGNIDTSTVWETPDPQEKEFREGEFININDASGCNKKDEDVWGSDAGAKLLNTGTPVRYFTSLKVQRTSGSGFRLRKDYDHLPR